MELPAIGIIGGAGVFGLEGFDHLEEHDIDTPFGKPSCSLMGGEVHGRKVWFLARHGIGHRIMSHEVNHRANIWALRSLGVRWLISVSTVGSLREEVAPRCILLNDQFFDRTSTRQQHTFFGEGIVAHIEFSEPVTNELHEIFAEAAAEVEADFHKGGTYVCIDGPAFSTRAENVVYRSYGFDAVGLTTLPEAKLARESEMAFVSMATVAAYDCWRPGGGKIDPMDLGKNLAFNLRTGTKVITEAIKNIPHVANWDAHNHLDVAIFTQRHLWPEETIERIRPILGKRVPQLSDLEEECQSLQA